MSNRSEKIKPDRPEPVRLSTEAFSVSKQSDHRDAAQKLQNGEYGVVEDRFSTGMAVLSELKKCIFRGKNKQDFAAYRDVRSLFYHASNRLLVPVENNQIALKKSPEIGWLKELYPDIETFMLTFPQIQGLNSSWQWHLRGIEYPGLKERIHPFYGTYFPTRFDHLRLFYNWLRQYSGKKTEAIDVGTGCGVLAFQMLNCGFENVAATDINPNAIISVKQHAEKTGLSDRIDSKLSDLFEAHNQKADLVVFNPPWLPAQKDTEGLDGAIYYEPDLFERFFSDVRNRLKEGGRVVILFSNLAESVGISDEHPVKKELQYGGRFNKIGVQKRKVVKASKKTKRRDHRKREFVELWELEPA